MCMGQIAALVVLKLYLLHYLKLGHRSGCGGMRLRRGVYVDGDVARGVCRVVERSSGDLMTANLAQYITPEHNQIIITTLSPLNIYYNGIFYISMYHLSLILCIYGLCKLCFRYVNV